MAEFDNSIVHLAHKLDALARFAGAAPKQLGFFAPLGLAPPFA